MADRTISYYILQGAWAFCLAFILVCLEIVMGDFGWLFPAAALTAFYLTISHDWRVGGLAASLATVAVEIILGRRFTMIPLMLLVVAGAAAWRIYGNRASAIGQVVPGVALGFLYAAAVLILENTTLRGGLAISLGRAVKQTGGCMLLAGFALPVLVCVVDWAAERLEIRQYHKRSPAGTNLT